MSTNTNTVVTLPDSVRNFVLGNIGTLEEKQIIKGVKSIFDFTLKPEMIVNLKTEVETAEKMAKLSKLSQSDRFAMMRAHPEYKVRSDPSYSLLAEFHAARGTFFAWAKSTFNLDLRWSSEDAEERPARAERNEGSNANGGREKGGSTYKTGTYTNGDYILSVDHSLDGKGYSECVLFANGTSFVVPSPRIASDFVCNLHEVLEDRKAADERGEPTGTQAGTTFWIKNGTYADVPHVDHGSSLDNPVPQAFKDWAKNDSRDIVETFLKTVS
jgi:hypothetical protein